MKKSNIAIIILAFLLIVVTIIATVNIVAIAQMKMINPGMTYSEVEKILGERVPTSWSGMPRLQWRLINGDVIRIPFEYSDERGTYVTGYFIE